MNNQLIGSSKLRLSNLDLVWETLFHHWVFVLDCAKGCPIAGSGFNGRVEFASLDFVRAGLGQAQEFSTRTPVDSIGLMICLLNCCYRAIIVMGVRAIGFRGWGDRQYLWDSMVQHPRDRRDSCDCTSIGDERTRGRSKR